MGLSDLVGVLAVVIYLAGIGAVTVRTVMLCLRISPTGRGLLTLFALAGGLYILLIAIDVPSVVAVLSNDVDDIPPASTLRAAVFGVFTWTLHSLLYRLARGRLD